MNDVSVILLSHRRHENIPILVQRLQNQTIKPKEIIIWNNYNEKQIDIKIPGIKCINSTYNFKFFARWAVGLLCNSEYLATLDDDCPPGPKWIEHSMHLMGQEPGIYGRKGGYLLNPRGNYNLQGIESSCSDKKPDHVDICGHSWFFKREWLSSVMREIPPFIDNGEDIFLSYTCQKYLGIKTFISHAKDPECLPYWNPDELKYSGTQQASYILNPGHDAERARMIHWCMDNGWKLIKGEK